ncbi:hypothetical protein REPUB_Repub15cG0125200 [Reevesia pubescens]
MRIREPWKNTLIVKLIGCPLSYTYICNRIKQLWSLKGSFEEMDMDNGFFCIRFGLSINYNFVLENGPWIIADHYLTINRWSPGFWLEEASIDKVAAWVYFLDLPLKFYDSAILRRMGNLIGKAVRIDRTTSNILRGKFARLCVDLDLSKPLVSKIFIAGRWQRVEYKGLKMLCYHCGRFGHNENECEVKKKVTLKSKHKKMAEVGKFVHREFESQRFGPWMITKKKYRKPINAKTDGNDKQPVKEVVRDSAGAFNVSGSRYEVLGADDEKMEETEVVPNTLEGDQEAAVGSSRENTISDREALKKNFQTSALISNKSGSKKGDNGKRVKNHAVYVISSKTVPKEKKNQRIEIV